MTNKAAHKIRQLKKSSKDQTPTVTPKAKHLLFWIFAILSVSAIIYLSYLAYTSELKPELVMSFISAVAALFILIIWYAPKFYVRSLPIETGKDFDREKERLKLEDDTRKTFAQIIGGIVFLGGLIFTYNTFRLQQNTYQLQQEGQFTDRFTKAVAQIGNDKLEIRLGGLYALERIAKDSPKDYWTVMEVLSAFIRQNSKKKRETSKKNSDDNFVSNTTGAEENAEITIDIQAALTIIGRRNIEQDSPINTIDLSKTNLRGAKLIGANLIKANLFEVDLNGADLKNANLNGANLSHAKLVGANLDGAKLIEANLIEANLSKASSRLSTFEYANLSRAILSNGANFFRTNFRYSKLIGTYIQNSKIDRADFSQAEMQNINLEGTFCLNADLSGTRIETLNSNEPKALTLDQLKEMIIDEKTLLPKEFLESKGLLIETSRKNIERK